MWGIKTMRHINSLPQELDVGQNLHVRPQFKIEYQELKGKGINRQVQHKRLEL